MAKSQVINLAADFEGDFESFRQKNIGLLRKVARKVHARLHAMGAAVEYDDVEQEATIVMMRAFEGYDPSTGFAFSTYFTKAAFYDLNKFVRDHEKDVQVLGVFSMDAAVGEDEDGAGMEGYIDGGHGSPEQLMEAQQLLREIEERLSPLAYKMLELMIDPPELVSQEWETTRKMQQHSQTEMTVGFVGNYLRRVMGVSAADIRFASAEIGNLKRSLHV